jgi:hypothetical protein
MCKKNTKKSSVPDKKQMYKKIPQCLNREEIFDASSPREVAAIFDFFLGAPWRRRAARVLGRFIAHFFDFFFILFFCLGDSVLRRIYYTLPVYVSNADGACRAGGGAREEEGGGGRVDGSRCGFVVPVRR